MKFTIKSIILVTVLILLLVSVLVQLYVMYQISNSKAYELENNDKEVKSRGTDAPTFWATNKMGFVGPSVGNLLAMGLVGLFLLMG